MSAFARTPFGAMTFNDLAASPQFGTMPRWSLLYYAALATASRADEQALTAQLAERRSFRKNQAIEYFHGRMPRPQSLADGALDTESSTATVVEETVIRQPGQDDENASPFQGNSAAPSSGMLQRYHLENFFKRPVKVYHATWGVGTHADADLRIPHLWVTNPHVRAKLLNYRYFRGDFVVTITVTGTQFHYGKVLLSYQPYDVLNETLVAYKQLHTALPTFDTRECQINYLSQGHNITQIDLHENKPVTIRIPFMSPKQAYVIGNNESTLMTNASIFPDFFAAGCLYIRGINPVSVGQAGLTKPVSVVVYVHAEDVQLSIPTSTHLNITSQAKVSRTFGGEYASPGPIATTATAVANIAGSVSASPQVGLFQQAAQGVAAVAQHFGWSRPAQLEDATYVKNNPYTNGATTEGRDQAYKLSVDPKQGLSVGAYNGAPSTGEDELSVAVLGAKEAYVGTSTWTDTQEGLASYIAQIAVGADCSTFHAQIILGESRRLIEQPTPMAFAADPFQFWRGDITYRVEIVGSAFHRGVGFIGFEPNMYQWNLIKGGHMELNEQNGIIFDIQDTRELEITVRWNSEYMWLKTTNQVYGQPQTPHMRLFRLLNNESTADFGTTVSNKECLGVLFMMPFTTSVQPAADSPLYVNWYVKSPNLQVAAPWDLGLTQYRTDILPEGEELVAEPDLFTIGGEENPTIPQPQSAATVEDLVPTGASAEHTCDLHFGEAVVSLRQMLKRYHGDYRVPATTLPAVTAGNSHGQLVEGTFRLYPGPDWHYFTNDSNTDPALRDQGLPARGNLFRYMRYAYLGMRGGMRYRVRPYGPQMYQQDQNWAMAFRQPPVLYAQSANTVAVAELSPGVPQPSNAPLINGNRVPFEGGQLFYQINNAGVEFEVPFYSTNLFAFSFSNTEGQGFTNGGTLLPTYIRDECCTWRYRATLRNYNSAGATGFLIAMDSAIAEDFTFFHYVGAPFRTFLT